MSRETHSVVKCLLKAGVRPKYIAFDYVYYILVNYSTTDIVHMTQAQIMELITKQFHISASKAASGLSTLIGYTMQLADRVSEEMPCLEKDENPSLKEFLLILSVLADEYQD